MELLYAAGPAIALLSIVSAALDVTLKVRESAKLGLTSMALVAIACLSAADEAGTIGAGASAALAGAFVIVMGRRREEGEVPRITSCHGFGPALSLTAMGAWFAALQSGAQWLTAVSTGEFWTWAVCGLASGALVFAACCAKRGDAADGPATAATPAFLAISATAAAFAAGECSSTTATAALASLSIALATASAWAAGKGTQAASVLAAIVTTVACGLCALGYANELFGLFLSLAMLLSALMLREDSARKPLAALFCMMSIGMFAMCYAAVAHRYVPGELVMEAGGDCWWLGGTARTIGAPLGYASVLACLVAIALAARMRWADDSPLCDLSALAGTLIPSVSLILAISEMASPVTFGSWNCDVASFSALIALLIAPSFTQSARELGLAYDPGQVTPPKVDSPGHDPGCAAEGSSAELGSTAAVQRRVLENKAAHAFNVSDLNLETLLLYGEVAEMSEKAMKGRPFGDEAADCAIYLLGISEIAGFDLGREVDAKMRVNEGRLYSRDGKGFAKVEDPRAEDPTGEAKP